MLRDVQEGGREGQQKYLHYVSNHEAERCSVSDKNGLSHVISGVTQVHAKYYIKLALTTVAEGFGQISINARAVENTGLILIQFKYMHMAWRWHKISA